MNCIPYVSSHKPKMSLSAWANKPIKYESTIFVKDILNMITYRMYAWVTTRPDLDLGLSYESFRDQYIKVLYYGYQTQNFSDTVTDYFDLKYLEETSDVYNECMKLAAHYQIGIPKIAMMDTLEYIRDNVIIYDPGEEEYETDPGESY